MVVAHHHESFHNRDFNFESLCHFEKSQDKEFRARFHHITFNVNNGQRGRGITKTHVGYSRTIQYPQCTVNRQPFTSASLLDERYMERKNIMQKTSWKSNDTYWKQRKRNSLMKRFSRRKNKTNSSTRTTKPNNVVGSLLVYNTKVERILDKDGSI